MCAGAKLLIVFQGTYIRCTYTVPITLKADIEKQEDKVNLLDYYL